MRLEDNKAGSIIVFSILTLLHTSQRGVDNLAKPLKENIIEGLMVLVKKMAIISICQL